MSNTNKPVRMCIGCRGKFLQIELIRLQSKNCNLIKYSGVGRSFYICKNCIDNNKNLFKKLLYQLKCKNVNFEELRKNLKEIIADA